MNIEDSSKIYYRTIRVIFFIVLPLIVTILILSNDFLTIWINSDFALKSSPVLKWLAVGVLANMLAQVPFGWLQAGGYANLTTRFHLIELPIYLILLFTSVKYYGLVGVAVSCTARMILDLSLLLAFVKKVINQEKRPYQYIQNLLLIFLVYVLMTIVLSYFLRTAFARFSMCLLVFILYAIILYTFILHNDERVFVRTIFASVFSNYRRWQKAFFK